MCWRWVQWGGPGWRRLYALSWSRRCVNFESRTLVSEVSTPLASTSGDTHLADHQRWYALLCGSRSCLYGHLGHIEYLCVCGVDSPRFPKWEVMYMYIRDYNREGYACVRTSKHAQNVMCAWWPCFGSVSKVDSIIILIVIISQAS